MAVVNENEWIKWMHESNEREWVGRVKVNLVSNRNIQLQNPNSKSFVSSWKVFEHPIQGKNCSRWKKEKKREADQNIMAA